jgi:hypothetical protein|tara:strand:- start:130 stop:306 length:177 start_codon:yes stop_codon:yes gene_type:complete
VQGGQYILIFGDERTGDGYGLAEFAWKAAFHQGGEAFDFRARKEIGLNRKVGAKATKS